MKVLILTIGLVMLVNCKSKPRFDNWELSWLNVYSQDDTLIFESTNHELDTTFIGKKDLFYQEYMGSVSLYGVIWYRNKNLKYHPEGARLITLVKSQSNRTSFNINYLYSSFLATNFDRESMKKSIEGEDTFVFNTFHPNGQKMVPRVLFWDAHRGLVKYITHDDVVWIRAN